MSFPSRQKFNFAKLGESPSWRSDLHQAAVTIEQQQQLRSGGAKSSLLLTGESLNLDARLWQASLARSRFCSGSGAAVATRRLSCCFDTTHLAPAAPRGARSELAACPCCVGVQKSCPKLSCLVSFRLFLSRLVAWPSGGALPTAPPASGKHVALWAR